MASVNVTYELTIEQDDVPVRGNVLASGNDADDKAAEDFVHSELARGNVAAWCRMTVTARVDVDGQTFEGRDSIGCCSYESEAKLRENHEEEMKQEALHSLKDSLTYNMKRGVIASRVLKGLK